MKHLAWLVCVLLLAGCATTRKATYQVRQDSTYNASHRLDSLFRVMLQRDSVYQRDSIYIYEKGDTVTKYVERTRYKLERLTDTLRVERWRIDTLVVRTDSVRVEKPVYIEKQLRWYDKGFIWVGRLCCIAAILWGLFLYLKRKF